MDVITTLTFFDRFHAHHQTTCGATRLSVSFEHRWPEEELMFVTLACPGCGRTISGAISNTDLLSVGALLEEGKAN